MNKTLTTIFALAVACVTAVSHAQEAKGDVEAGKQKIAMCIGCHGIPGYQASFPEVHKVPKISGQSEAYLAAALMGYRKGDRKHPSMKAIATSLIGTHLIAAVTGGHFVSLVDPPPGATAAAARCRQRRCFPVLAGPPDVDDLLLISPIILYDHPAVAEQSDGALYDSTEIDEILTLRVMTMTDQEKLQARATDARAAAIIDRIVHHGRLIEFTGPSRRVSQALMFGKTDNQ